MAPFSDELFHACHFVAAFGTLTTLSSAVFHLLVIRHGFATLGTELADFRAKSARLSMIF